MKSNKDWNKQLCTNRFPNRDDERLFKRQGYHNYVYLTHWRGLINHLNSNRLQNITDACQQVMKAHIDRFYAWIPVASSDRGMTTKKTDRGVDQESCPESYRVDAAGNGPVIMVNPAHFLDYYVAWNAFKDNYPDPNQYNPRVEGQFSTLNEHQANPLDDDVIELD